MKNPSVVCADGFFCIVPVKGTQKSANLTYVEMDTYPQLAVYHRQ